MKVKKFGKVCLSFAVASALALGFSGCSDDEESSGSSSNSSGIEVERGKVYNAKVYVGRTLAGTYKEATPSPGSNIYSFDQSPSDVVSVKSGWIDIDGDGVATTSDVELDLTLTNSTFKTNIITPITTWIGSEQERLDDLESEFGVTKDELLTVPSKATKEVILIANAIYYKGKTVYDEYYYYTNDIDDVTIDDIRSEYDELKTVLDQSGSTLTSSEEIAKFVEAEVIRKLEEKERVTKLTQTRIDEIDVFNAIDGGDFSKTITSSDVANYANITVYKNISTSSAKSTITTLLDADVKVLVGQLDCSSLGLVYDSEDSSYSSDTVYVDATPATITCTDKDYSTTANSGEASVVVLTYPTGQ